MLSVQFSGIKYIYIVVKQSPLICTFFHPELKLKYNFPFLYPSSLW